MSTSPAAWTTTAVTPITGYVNVVRSDTDNYSSHPCPAVLTQQDDWGRTRVVAAVLLGNGHLVPAVDSDHYVSTDPA